jgi:hypothetical protein
LRYCDTALLRAFVCFNAERTAIQSGEEKSGCIYRTNTSIRRANSKVFDTQIEVCDTIIIYTDSFEAGHHSMPIHGPSDFDLLIVDMPAIEETDLSVFDLPMTYRLRLTVAARNKGFSSRAIFEISATYGKGTPTSFFSLSAWYGVSQHVFSLES